MVSHGESWRGSCAARDVTDLAIGSSDWLALSDHANKSVILAMITDPKPNEIVSILNRQRSNR